MSTALQTIVDLLRESVLVQGAITFVVIGVYAYLVVIGQPVPDDFKQVALLIIGFFFGQKVARPVTETRVRDLARAEAQNVSRKEC